MENKHKIICAAILALGLAALGYEIRAGINDLKEKDRIVTVKGLSEREVPADKVTWPLVYKEIGSNPVALYQSMESKNYAIVKFLKEGGLTDSEISITPPALIDMQAERYGNNQTPYRYNATAVITVTSSQVETVRQLIMRQAELLKQGIAIVGDDYSHQVVYSFTGLNDIKPDMVKEATQNAQAVAEQFAQNSSSRLGKIRTATQGQFSIENRDSDTPHIKSVRVVTTVCYYLKK